MLARKCPVVAVTAVWANNWQQLWFYFFALEPRSIPLSQFSFSVSLPEARSHGALFPTSLSRDDWQTAADLIWVLGLRSDRGVARSLYHRRRRCLCDKKRAWCLGYTPTSIYTRGISCCLLFCAVYPYGGWLIDDGRSNSQFMGYIYTTRIYVRYVSLYTVLLCSTTSLIKHFGKERD